MELVRDETVNTGYRMAKVVSKCNTSQNQPRALTLYCRYIARQRRRWAGCTQIGWQRDCECEDPLISTPDKPAAYCAAPDTGGLLVDSAIIFNVTVWP